MAIVMAKIERVGTATFTATLALVVVFFFLLFTGEILREWVLLAFGVTLGVVSALGLCSNTIVAVSSRRLLPASRAVVCLVAAGAYAWFIAMPGWGEL